jgi:hypothetical protein
MIREQAPADLKHRGAMPPDHPHEGRLVAVGSETPEQVGVGDVFEVLLRAKVTQKMQQRRRGTSAHGVWILRGVLDAPTL